MVGRVLEEEVGDQVGMVELEDAAIERAKVDEVAEFLGVAEQEIGGVLAERASVEDAPDDGGSGGQFGVPAGANVWPNVWSNVWSNVWPNVWGWRHMAILVALDGAALMTSNR
jgi:hypothetical protein